MFDEAGCGGVGSAMDALFFSQDGWCSSLVDVIFAGDGLGMKAVGCDDGGCVAENLNEIYIFKWPKSPASLYNSVWSHQCNGTYPLTSWRKGMTHPKSHQARLPHPSGGLILRKQHHHEKSRQTHSFCWHWWFGYVRAGRGFAQSELHGFGF